MRSVFLLFLFLLGSVSIQAQEMSGSNYGKGNSGENRNSLQSVKTPSGYQGFCDQNTLYRFADDHSSTVGFSTTHGFYFNGHTFIGVGIGFEGGNEFWAVPVFSTLKYVFSNRKTISPTVQLRVGSYFSEDAGSYADLSLGLRFASKRDFAVNVMLVGSFFEMQKIINSYVKYDDVTGGYLHVEEEKKIYPSGLGLRIGIEW